ncbi:hypothetical protein BDQ17DRAFT_1365395 [Cyathus striatus]|nr:hypothetical protein BDQ17DRAFT_1365395 [Cyathus striatus]
MLRDLRVDVLDLDMHKELEAGDDEALLALLKARVDEVKEQKSRILMAKKECSRLKEEKEEKEEREKAERSLWEAVQGHSEDGSAPSSIEVLEHALHQIQYLREENELLKLVTEEARNAPTEINYTTNQGSAVSSQSPLRDEETTDTEHEETFHSPECSLFITSQLEEVELELAPPEYPVCTLPDNHVRLERQHSPDVLEGFKSLDPPSQHETEDILTEEQLNAIFKQIDDRKLCTICLTGSIEEYIEIPPSHDELRVVLTQHCVTKHGDILDLLRGLTADEIV